MNNIFNIQNQIIGASKYSFLFYISNLCLFNKYLTYFTFIFTNFDWDKVSTAFRNILYKIRVF